MLFIFPSSMAESDSLGGESGFEDQDTCVESGTSVKKFIGRFIDKVCVEGGVSEEYIRRTQAMVATCVDMHIEDCENVYKETKRLPPIQKVFCTDCFIFVFLTFK